MKWNFSMPLDESAPAFKEATKAWNFDDFISEEIEKAIELIGSILSISGSENSKQKMESMRGAFTNSLGRCAAVVTWETLHSVYFYVSHEGISVACLDTPLEQTVHPWSDIFDVNFDKDTSEFDSKMLEDRKKLSSKLREMADLLDNGVTP